MAKLITPSQPFGYTNMYLDFLAGLYSARHLYAVDNISDVAEQLDSVQYPRDAVADILRQQNSRYRASRLTFDHIEQLRQKETLCVFAGQQAVLFGGPLLITIKALAIVKAARQYSEELNRQVIPIFWIAGDDHDFEEVNHTYVFNRDMEPVRVAYESPPDLELPTSEITFSDREALNRAKEQLREALGDTDFTPELYDLIDSCHTPEDTFVSAFGKLMASLTKDTGLVFFSPGDPDAKRLAAPFFESIIDKQHTLHSRISCTNEHIESHGYHIQVEKSDDAVHLFCNRHGRLPVKHADDSFTIGDEHISRDKLLELIQNEPHLFSPDVMTRPILQSWLFPVVSQKGGPSEIAYLAQINPLFDLFDRPAPLHAARPSATIIEKRFEKVMQQHEISFEELIEDVEQVINRVLTASFPENLEEKFRTMTEQVEKQFKDFVKESLQFDPSLESFAHQIYGKIDYNIKQFEGKVFSSHKRRSKDTRERIYKLWQAVFPNRGLQERSINVLYFLSKYSRNLIPFISDQLQSEEEAHQLIHLSEYKG